jgi:AraC family transcriptional regulator
MTRHKLIDKALRHIEAHLREDLNLEDIAAVANYSPWHFHRLFYSSTGTTVGEYVRKRRLSEASKELVQSDKPIKQIAADYRFESQAAFTRSLKSYCGCTPGKLRKQVRALICYQPVIRIKTSGENMKEPRIVHKDRFRVIGISCVTTMNTNCIPSLWDDFNKMCSTIPGVSQSGAALGVCFYEEMEEMTGDTPFTYLAGMEVHPDTPQPEGMQERVVEASEYAVFEHIGSPDTLHDTYGAIYQDWLPQSGRQRKNADDFELYDDRFIYGDPKSVMEIWIPII